ncbi:hypothetical protein PoB_007274200 [Plakobranchus ocellatus]|uniref:Uncharacterized protein n=1 Tax=Plakobranchus ocellatus TaxID=259542 RepID=A0AAV4DQ52_9GAST|nr:hypothetical protein PoB_007274200 [Plakobranchus ocellatus]
MKLGVMGGFFHMMSTDNAPNHRLCPKGPTSWCKYNRALANNQTTPPHNPTFTPDIGKYVFPVIKRLTDTKLLRRCVKMTTKTRMRVSMPRFGSVAQSPNLPTFPQ